MPVDLSDYVVGDGIANDTNGLIEAATIARNEKRGLYLPKDLSIRIVNTVDLKFIDLDIQGKIIVEMIDGIGVKIGGSSFFATPLKVFINSIKNKAPANVRSDTKFTLQVEGVKNAQVSVAECDSMRVYADGRTNGLSDNNLKIGSVSYSHFTLGKIDYFYITSINVSEDKESSGWINENTFLNGRFRHIEIDGSYRHEQNVFIKPCFENGLLWMKTGNANIFYSARTEGSSICFESRTSKNIIYDAFYPNNLTIKKNNLVAYDYGSENQVVTNLESVYTKIPIMDLVPNTSFRTMDDSDYVFPDPGYSGQTIQLDTELNVIKIFNYAKIFDQRISAKTVKRFKIEYTPYDSAVNPKGCMLNLKCYDENMQVLVPSDPSNINTWDITANGMIWVGDNQSYKYSANIGNEYILFCNRVKYVDFQLTGGYLPANSGFDCKRLMLSAYVNPFDSNEVSVISNKIIKPNKTLYGTSVQRPKNPSIGMPYFDCALGKVINCKTMAVMNNCQIVKSAVWVDATGATV